MATLSIHSLWESYNYTGGPGRGKDNDGVADYCKLTRGKPILPASFEKRKEPERADAITDENKADMEVSKNKLIAPVWCVIYRTTQKMGWVIR